MEVPSRYAANAQLTRAGSLILRIPARRKYAGVGEALCQSRGTVKRNEPLCRLTDYLDYAARAMVEGLQAVC